MKLKANEATVETSLGLGRSVEMGFSKKNIGKLMFLMSNLYNDPITAVIREYFTNAVDAHVRAGQTKPVEIYLPTRDNPLYVVKDEGVGMTDDDMEFIYSQYGESTKEETNEESGAFGLGCKAGLAINPQFTLTSVKDGKKTTAIVSNSPTGVNKLDILPSKLTDEPNGTTVTVPVTNITEFNEKAEKFFQYVAPGVVLVNGMEPTFVLSSAREIDLGVSGVTAHVKEMPKYSYGTPTFKVIMGHVPYTLTTDNITDSFARTGIEFDLAQSKLHAFFTVSIGDVELTGAREGIRMTDETMAKIDEILKAYVENLRKTAQEDVDKVNDRVDVFAAIDKWSNILDRKKLIWRGQPVPQVVPLSDKSFPSVYRSGSDSTHSTAGSVSPRDRVTIVGGTDVEHYRKVALYLTPYMDEEGYGSRTFIFTDDTVTVTDPWLLDNSNIKFVQADKLVEIGKAKRKADREAKKKELGAAGKSGKVSYVLFNLTTGAFRSVPYDEIPAGTPYMDTDNYYSGIGEFFQAFATGKKSLDEHYSLGKRRQYGDAMAQFTSATELIIVSRPRKTSAVEDRVKGSYNVLKDINETIKDTFRSVPQRVKDIESIQNSSDMDKLIKRIKSASLESTVKDRELRRLINPTKKAKETHKRLSEYKKHLNTIKAYVGDVEIPATSDAVQTILDRYPLIEAISFGHMSTNNTDHLITYMNAVYEKNLTPAP